MGTRTAQNDTIIDTTSDNQVNSNFPYRWSPASLTFNNYFYLFLYLYITRITIYNNTLHLKSPKNQNRRAALGRPAMKLLGSFNCILRCEVTRESSNEKNGKNISVQVLSFQLYLFTLYAWMRTKYSTKLS